MGNPGAIAGSAGLIRWRGGKGAWRENKGEWRPGEETGSEEAEEAGFWQQGEGPVRGSGQGPQGRNRQASWVPARSLMPGPQVPGQGLGGRGGVGRLCLWETLALGHKSRLPAPSVSRGCHPLGPSEGQRDATGILQPRNSRSAHARCLRRVYFPGVHPPSSPGARSTSVSRRLLGAGETQGWVLAILGHADTWH